MKSIRFLLVATIVIGTLSGCYDYRDPENQRLNAWVSSIDWKSKNHGMPLIMLKRQNGTEQRFHHSSITLTSENLKIGDLLVKESGSKMCEINGKKIRCLK